MFKHKKIYVMPTIGFLIMIVCMTVLLKLPVCNRTRISNIDALFETTSAVTCTGSSVKDLSIQFTFWGQLVLLFGMEIGAVGFMMFFSLLFIMSKKKIKLSDTIFLGNEVNTSNYTMIKSKAKKVIKYTIVIETFGVWFLSIRWIPIYGVKQGLWYSIFHSVAAFCNAGLDIFGTESLVFFKNDIYTNAVLIILMFLGSLGFLVLEDFTGWYFKGKKSKIHVESKLILSTSVLLIIVSTILFRIFDPKLTWIQSIFFSVTSRNTGLFTVNVENLNQINQFLIVLFMFIGGGPGSNAGGIRVVVFAILILTMVATIKNQDEVVVFYRRIDDKTIKKAITILSIDFLIILIGILVIASTEKLGFIDTLFYVVSTFSNTGLSTIDISMLSFFGKWVSIFIMYIGKVAPVTFISLFIPMNDKRSGMKYPNMDMML